MHKTLDIVAIVGSLRRDSFTRRLVRSFDRLLPATVGIEILGIGDLPFYNQTWSLRHRRRGRRSGSESTAPMRFFLQRPSTIVQCRVF
jgi:NADPH-dependent FMN reductase